MTTNTTKALRTAERALRRISDEEFPSHADAWSASSPNADPRKANIAFGQHVSHLSGIADEALEIVREALEAAQVQAEPVADDDITALSMVLSGLRRIAGGVTQTNDDRLFAKTRKRKMTIRDAAEIATAYVPSLERLINALASPQPAAQVQAKPVARVYRHDLDRFLAHASSVGQYSLPVSKVHGDVMLYAQTEAHATEQFVQATWAGAIAEIELVLTDPDNKLSDGSWRSLKWVQRALRDASAPKEGNAS